MKTLMKILLFACFPLTGFSQDTTIIAKQNKQKPIATYQVGSSKVVVWENKRKDGTTWKNFKIEKVYQTKDGQWKTTNGFDRTELLELKAAIDKAVSEENVKTN